MIYGNVIMMIVTTDGERIIEEDAELTLKHLVHVLHEHIWPDLLGSAGLGSRRSFFTLRSYSFLSYQSS